MIVGSSYVWQNLERMVGRQDWRKLKFDNNRLRSGIGKCLGTMERKEEKKFKGELRSRPFFFLYPCIN
ncbi:unnamed protein product [Prunus armeniaca]|uniref:Uncharacterized protein n=1 Tax=Prunus armeniaca TaxID=36596 RepID=A0A6J5XVN0_PRUAR|nr:unnamed protein product [Prunus armeniaca]CAB4316322.1 unnamed protein product [Prunus armeniaca]